MDKFSQATQPGRFLVDVFPWLRFVPEWFPGAGWRKTAREWRQVTDRFYSAGYKWTLEQIVCILEGLDLALTCLISSETRYSHPFLHFGAPAAVGPRGRRRKRNIEACVCLFIRWRDRHYR
jgi:hypothetical protein